MRVSPLNLQSNSYAEIKKVIYQQGLMERQLGYYAPKIILTLSLLTLSIAFLIVADGLWLQLLNAAFLAFVFAQLSFIGHDAGHLQIFHSSRKNEVVGLIVSLLLGVDRSWWVTKHNRHHAYPNNVDLDPDADFPILAFTSEQAVRKMGLYRLIVKYQSYLFILMLSLEGFGLRLGGIQYLLRTKVKYPVAEPLLVAIHFAAYLTLVFYFLGAWHGALFIVVHQMLFGLCIGPVFAPNHKGMLTVEKDSQLDFLQRQVLTSRNVKPNHFIDFWYGGLNYQIEHHLFPKMPRNKLREAQKTVKAFCQANGLSYHETTVLQSYREILQHLHQVSVPLRA